MDMMFTVQRLGKIVTELEKLRLSNIFPVNEIYIAQCEDGSFEKPKNFQLFINGGCWGGANLHFCFQLNFAIPESYEGKTVILSINTDREGQWDATNQQFLAIVNDNVIQGLDVNHRELFLSHSAKAGDNYNIMLYAYSGSGMAFFSCNLAVLEHDIEALYYDLKVPLEAVECISHNDKRQLEILKCLEDTVAFLDFRKAYTYQDSFIDSVRRARSFINREFYEGLCGHKDFFVSGIGHTHIDVAWLWTLSQTREKVVRSFSTVLELMKHYPEYNFTSSQPQLYQFVKENMPVIYEQIKTRVAEGRWEPEGAMWLEADCNLISGESIIRQILFGKRFFKEEFNIESKILWLPDVFGYSAALPQILKKCGVDYFMTSKISWNEYNKAPYDTFLWEGIDGTTVPAYFITTTEPGQDYEKKHYTTYNGKVHPETLLGTWNRYQQKNLTNRVMLSYGHGDGGGGPTREMIEYGKRLSKGIPGIPRFEFDSLGGFLNSLTKQIKENWENIPRWVGELYLEYHRGTYTSMARNKKYNRKSELMIMEAEGLNTITGSLLKESYQYRELNEIWKTILLNQFHDIIPGSSIKAVYEESKKQYENILDRLNDQTQKAKELIVNNMRIEDESLVVFNSTGFSMGGLVETCLPRKFKSIETHEGKLFPIQPTDEKSVIYVPDVPAKGYGTYALSTKEALTNNMSIDIDFMENRYYTIRFDSDGMITSIFDKENKREVIRSNERGNRLVAFEDIPHNYDAWDINIYYQKKYWEINQVESITVLERGPVRLTLEIKRRFLDSEIIQHIQIYAINPRIDFKTHIDWKERHLLLKAAFPVDVHSDKATYDIQFGNVERPTHWNTSWDMARFEVCAHKWADISENGYGVSLLNDCKYGYDIKDGTMRLTLLKSATYPNEDADREAHDFVYSLLPHKGDFRTCTIPHAYALNMPFTTVYAKPHDGQLMKNLSFVACESPHVTIETVKASENGEGIITRIIETHNSRGHVTLQIALPIKEAWECDMLEEKITSLSCHENMIELNILPYEVKTVLFVLSN